MSKCKMRNISLLSLLERFISTYTTIYAGKLFCRFVYPNVRNKAKSPVRRYLRVTATVTQRNKK